MSSSGILLVNKSKDSTSFQIVSLLRRITKEQTIGHSGTLDPFATGVMVMLLGREYTRKSNTFLEQDKEYRTTLHLGIATETYDTEGEVVSRSDLVPSMEQIQVALQAFRGEISQIPPMYSAKKVGGKKLCDLARKGITIERQPARVTVHSIQLLSYAYPYLELHIACSKGTYIRSLAHDIGHMLGCGAYLSALTRTRSGSFRLEECLSQELLKNPSFDIAPYLRQQ